MDTGDEGTYMSSSEKHFEHGGLRIEVDSLPGRVMLRWIGVSDTRDPSAHLAPFFLSLLDIVRDRSVTLDFRGFEYMNSATVSPIINLVKSLDAHRVPTTLLFDATVPWQKINAQCMRAISRTLSSVQVP